MADAVEQLLLKFGLDLSGAKQAAAQLKGILGELNQLSAEAVQKGTAVAQAQKQALTELQNAAKIATDIAKQAVTVEKAKQAAIQAQTEDLKRQAASYSTASAASKASADAERAKQEIIRTQTAAIQQQIQERKAETAEIQKQIALQRQERAEQGGGGGYGPGGSAGFVSRLGRGLFGGGLSGGIAAGILTGGGITLMAESLGRELSMLVDKFKQVAEEAGKLTLVEDRFQRAAVGLGINPAKMMEQLQVATTGLVDKLHLAEFGAKALQSSMRLSPEKIAEVSGAVVRLAESSGHTATEAMNALGQALSRGGERAGVMLARVTGLTREQLMLGNLATGLNRNERSVTQLSHAFDTLIAKSRELGELPETFEQLETRIKVAIKDVTLSFGEGLNLSGGSQQFIKVMSGNARALDELSAKAKAFGESFGNAILAITPALTFLKDTLFGITSLLMDTLHGLDDLFGSVASGANKSAETIRFIGNFILTVNLLVQSLIRALATLAQTAIGIGKVIWDVSSAIAAAGTGQFALAKQYSQQLLKDEKDIVKAWTTDMKDFGDKMQQEFEDFNAKIEQMKVVQAPTRRPGITPPPPPGVSHVQAGIKDAQQQMREQQALAKLLLQERQNEIAQEKELDDEAYRNSEEALDEHIAKQKRIAIAGFLAREDELRQEFAARSSELDEVMKQRLSADGVTANLRAQLQKDHDTQLETYRLLYERQSLVAAKNLNQQLVNLDRQGEQDRSQAALKGVQDRLAAEREATQAGQKELEKQLQTGGVTPEEFSDKKIQLIRQEALAEQLAASQTFELNKRNEKALADYKSALRKAEQKEQEATATVLAGNVNRQLEAVQKPFGLQQKGLELGVTAAQQTGQTAVARQLTEDIINNIVTQRLALQGLLEAARPYPEIWLKVKEAIAQLNEEQTKYNEKLQQMHDIMGVAAGNLGTLGQGIGEVFRSKFAQGLAQTVGIAVRTTQQAPKDVGAVRQLITGTNEKGEDVGFTMDNFTKGLAGAVQAISGFVNSLTSAKSAIGGALGGGISGMGLGAQIGGPIGAIVGGIGGAALGAITGNKAAQVQLNITNLNNTFKEVMNQFALNTNNLQNTIQQLQILVESARQMQANSKKGSSQYQQVIDQYNQQIMQLQQQQNSILVNMHEQLAIIQAPTQAQDLLQSLDSIIKSFDQFWGAAKVPSDFTDALNFLNTSLQQYQATLSQQVVQANEQAINDAINLNDLLYQRQQLVLQMSQQIEGVLSQGVLTRQFTRAQQAGQQIYNIQFEGNRQMDVLNEQIAAAQYRVNAEGQIFTLASTRVGLETQLLGLQNAQTQYDMIRIQALMELTQAMQSGNYNWGPLQALINALPPVTNPNSPISGNPLSGLLNGTGITPIAGTNSLDGLIAAAYQDRSSLGFASFRGTNLQ